MRIARRHDEDHIEINVIPLIDVLLCLLMFFVLTTTFEHHTKLHVVLPEASAEAESQVRTELVVAIDREGRYFVGSNEVLNPGLETLKDALAAAAGDDRERKVTLRADGRTPHQAVVTAMDAIGQLGFSSLSIATVPAGATP